MQVRQLKSGAACHDVVTIKKMVKSMYLKLLLGAAVVVSLGLGGASLIQNRSLMAGEQIAATTSGGISSNSALGQANPQGVYDQVWRWIQEEYYDKTFNGQNWSRWQHRYDGKLKTLEDSHKAIETMLGSLGDKYTRFLDKEEFEDEATQISAQFAGVGVIIGLNKDKRVVVIAPLDDTPAFKAGLLNGDEIFQVDAKPTNGLSVEEVAKMIKGKPGTVVKITVIRNKQKQVYNIVRAQIPLKSVQIAKMLDDKIGYIRLSSFISEKADTEMREAIEKLGNARGLILDLRDNPGGLLSNAINVSNMFLDSGSTHPTVIVSTVDRDGYRAPAVTDGNAICDLPLVVLINGGSASAAEITSGALRDNGRAILVGEKSFGKGLVQGIHKLKDLGDPAGVNITIARYLTPNDTDIHKKGIIPDVEIAVKEEDIKNNKGPWWIDINNTGKKRNPETLEDIQLARAYSIISKQVTKKTGT